MAFFHLKTVPGCYWPRLPDAAFAQVWNAYLELDRTQYLNRAAIEDLQLKQARTLLAHCASNVPYYQQVLAQAAVVPDAIRTMDDFRRIPLLARRTYQEKNESFFAVKFPPGTKATGTNHTSGSSGTPTAVHRTNMTELWWHAFFLRDLEWCGLDPTGSLAGIRFFRPATRGRRQPDLLRGVSYPCWSQALDHLIESGASHAMDVRQDPREQLRWLRRIAPDYLLSFSANLEALANLARTEGPLPSLKAIQSFASTLLPEVQAGIETVFGVPVKNNYSCNEAGYLASSCPQGHGLHIHAENVILEVLDAQDRPCAPGETGRVVITHLHNLRAPLVRYEVGDEATMGPAKCGCGRGLALLECVQGKAQPMLHMPDGRLKHTAILNSVVRLCGGHWQHQVVQKSLDHVVVRLAVSAAWTPAHADAIKQAVCEFLEAPVRVDVETHDRLELPGSGKFQSIISELDMKGNNIECRTPYFE